MKSLFKHILTSILILESKAILKKYKPRIVAVTGTVGKTSTKDAIFTVLSSSFHVRKSDKSFNSEIGVPLTILGCQNGWNDPFIWLSNILHGLELIIFKSEYPQYLVLEVGADHPGDIQSISKWLTTDIVVITRIGDVPVHVEFYASPDEVVKEKSYLITSLKKEGTLILFADDKKVSGMSQNVTQTISTFGVNEMATVTGSNISIAYDDMKIPDGMSFKINHKGNSIPMKIKGIIGIQQVYPVLAAVTVGIVSGISIPKIVDAFEFHEIPQGRMNILKGLHGSTIVDDSYNSSPDALREGLSTLSSLQVSGKRIAVLGDMMELGNFSADEHKKAGVQALQSCDILITVGQRAKFMVKESTQSVEVIHFDSSEQAAEYVKGIVKEGDVIFVKGSQSMRMEKVSKALLLEPEKAEKVLVRQNKEWLAKK